MKTLILTLTLIMASSIIQAQIVQLSEAKVEYTPTVSAKGDHYLVNVTENVPGEFEKDPVEFAKRNFDINGFIELVKRDEIESYHVTFRSRKGQLVAEFARDGKLLQTSQKFKNVRLPLALSHQLYRDYEGWKVVKNTRVASGKEARLDQDFYLITMRNGSQKKNLRINNSPSGDYVVAQL